MSRVGDIVDRAPVFAQLQLHDFVDLQIVPALPSLNELDGGGFITYTGIVLSLIRILLRLFGRVFLFFFFLSFSLWTEWEGGEGGGVLFLVCLCSSQTDQMMMN